MNNIKKCFILFSMMILAFSSGCQARTESYSTGKYRVTVVNSSQVPVHQIAYEMNGQSGGGMNADGSLIRQGEEMFFDFDEISGHAVWSVLDEDDATMVSDTLSFAFDEKNGMIIDIESGKDKLKLTVRKP